jgi:hypothetical protein
MTVKPGWARKRDRLRRREAAAARADTSGASWELSATDWRLLTITFAGGLGSIVAGACIIGGAIALDRLLAPNPHRIEWWGVVAATVIWLLTLSYLPHALRSTTDPDKLPQRVTILAIVGLGSALFILFWIGLAAVIH